MKRRYGITPQPVGERLERFAAPRRIGYLLALCAAAAWPLIVVLVAHDVWRMWK